jgi:lipid II:glycine glycyltransferase (peptidoglycan interpeptide bridge formation enzyme)
MPGLLTNSGLTLSKLGKWQALVESHPETTVFHHRNWIELLREQYGFRLHIPAVEEGGELLAAVPFLEIRKPWGSKKLMALPFSDYMRVLARDDRALQCICEALKSEPFDNYKSVLLRTDSPLGGFATLSAWVRHEMSTTRPIDEIVAESPPSVRRNLRRAERSGLRFERRTDAAAMESFYRLHLATRKRHGLPVQPKSFFRRLCDRVLRCELGFIGVVSKNDEAIAAGVFLTYNKTMTYKYGASQQRCLRWRPNDFMFYNVIRLAGEEGYKRLDFGISCRPHKGLRRFKSKWGSTETDVYNVYFAGSDHRTLDDSRTMKVGAAVIRHSPAIVCRGLGEIFYRFSQ